MWARAVWDGAVPAADLHDAWRRAITQVGLAERPFQAVRGPVGAMVASALRKHTSNLYADVTHPTAAFLKERQDEVAFWEDCEATRTRCCYVCE